MSPSSAVGPKERVVAEVVGATDPEGRAFASRSDWLSAAGHLTEEECYVEGIGLYLLSEIDGVTRASIMTEQSAVALSEDKIKKINRQQYEQILLVGGGSVGAQAVSTFAPEQNRGTFDVVTL